MLKQIISLLVLSVVVYTGGAQVCTHPGQTPESAILVCGTESFTAGTATFCGNLTVPAPCPGGFPYENKNPNFFRMLCFQGGTLGFVIVPNDPLANYDWQLFDVTNVNPGSIFTNQGLFITCNWSSEPGETGASPDGLSPLVCGGPGEPLFTQMPQVVAGRSYMLMVCNQSASAAGYEISFTGGSASITDNVDPHLLRAALGCNSRTVIVRTNKKIVCGTLAADGSDFMISGGAQVISAVPGDCSSPFGTDSLILTMASPLPGGNYTLSIKQGSDGQTLSDNCQRYIPAGETLSFTSGPVPPTPMDSVFKTGCSPSYIELIFRKRIQCSSVAADGSDFVITGPQAATVTPSFGNCDDEGYFTRIRLNFASPLTTGGTYQVQLVPGSDGNTLIDICGMSTPSGSMVHFAVTDPISPVFSYLAPPSCTESLVHYFHDGNNQTITWAWSFGDGSFSDQQNPVKKYAAPGLYTVKLEVSNGKCTDTASRLIAVSGDLYTGFELPATACAGDTIRIINTSSTLFDQWHWQLGDGRTSSDFSPDLYRYYVSGREAWFTVTLVAGHSAWGCGDTVSRVVRVLASCLVGVPAAFTPNADGLNDYLYPLNAVKAEQLQFNVYNRQGQLVFSTRDWTRKWDGRIRGLPQPAGVYAWTLSYVHRDTEEKVYRKGTTLLLR